MKPWELAKTDIPRLNAVLTVLCESIRSIAFGIAPFMPDTARKIFDFINVEGKSFREIENNFVDQRFDITPFPLFPKDK
jgi:methionyl-tRNA synthetase